MNSDERVILLYETTDEDGRPSVPGKDDLIRLRTWDIFDRYLTQARRLIDIGGGPGVRAAYLAERAFDVELIAVEGYGWLLGDLERRMEKAGPLFRAIWLTETEPSMLGCCAHVIGTATPRVGNVLVPLTHFQSSGGT